MTIYETKFLKGSAMMPLIPQTRGVSELYTIIAGQQPARYARLASFLQQHRKIDPYVDTLQYDIFAAALARQFDSRRANDINIYLRQFELPQITLFNLLTTKFPLAAATGSIANDMLCRSISEGEEITLFDVGIGTGQQEVALLHQLAAHGRRPKQLRLIAVEPSATNLMQAQQDLERTAGELGISLIVHPIPKLAEDLNDDDWRIVAQSPGALVVNAAFALHHMRDVVPEECARETFFRKLRAFHPRAVVLCEPNSDHRTVSLEERFLNAWRHFGLIFRLINRLDLSQRDKNAMKMFFAREIEDIVGNTEEHRCERHELAAAWVNRLRRTGYAPARIMDNLAAGQFPTIAINHYDGYIGVDYNGETMVAIVCATAEAV
jgi:hypothetical protein